MIKTKNVKTPFWSGVEFYNKLYREGLLVRIISLPRVEDLTEKYTKGQYHWWNCKLVLWNL